LTQYALRDTATFEDDKYQFELRDGLYSGVYYMSTDRDSKSQSGLPSNARPYRIGHRLAQDIVSKYKAVQLPEKMIEFDYSGTQGKTALLETLVGKSGWMRVERVSIDSFEQEDHILLACYTDDGVEVYPEIAERMLLLSARAISPIDVDEGTVENICTRIEQMKLDILEESALRNQVFFEEEMEKLDSWADDMKVSLEREITDLDAEIKLRKSETKKMLRLNDKVAAQRVIKDLEKKRAEKRQNLYEAQDEVDAKKENLLSSVEKMLEQKIEQEELFTIRWRII
jgi:hypothetical protein